MALQAELVALRASFRHRAAGAGGDSGAAPGLVLVQDFPSVFSGEFISVELGGSVNGEQDIIHEDVGDGDGVPPGDHDGPDVGGLRMVPFDAAIREELRFGVSPRGNGDFEGGADIRGVCVVSAGGVGDLVDDAAAYDFLAVSSSLQQPGTGFFRDGNSGDGFFCC